MHVKVNFDRACNTVRTGAQCLRSNWKPESRRPGYAPIRASHLIGELILAVEFAQQYRIDLIPARTDSVRMIASHHEHEETTMTTHASHASRRRFIKIAASGLVAAPFANALLSGTAEAVDTVSESDPTATALGYKTDATRASNRKDTTAVCSNCSLYSGKPGAADGPCSVFGGKLVSAKGWCTAWVKKA